MAESLNIYACIYCNISFKKQQDLRTHCQLESHELRVMSDDGRDWNYRPPPRGLKSNLYTLCNLWQVNGTCTFGVACVEAHGSEELVEWQERFKYREMKYNKAQEKLSYGKSLSDSLLDNYIKSQNPGEFMKEKVEGVQDSCSGDMYITITSKNSTYDWDFNIKTANPFCGITLLHDPFRNYFKITTIKIGEDIQFINNSQEWTASTTKSFSDDIQSYSIKVSFNASIYGTFHQSVLFDFKTFSYLVKHLCVDVVSDTELYKMDELQKDIVSSLTKRWTKENCELIPFHSVVDIKSKHEKWEDQVKTMYPSPSKDNIHLSQDLLNDKKFTKNNYKHHMHQLLFIEECSRVELVSKYNLMAFIQLAFTYILCPDSTAASTAKFATNGELFGAVTLGSELSEDFNEGRLILMHSDSIFLCPKDNLTNTPLQIFEAKIEDKTKKIIYLRFSSEVVQILKLKPGNTLEAKIQFQLNRLPYCIWHYAVDRMSNVNLIFPETYLEPSIPWSPDRQWSQLLDSRLNPKQKEAIVAITTPLNVFLPPILVIGPYGTGKTFTLAQAVKDLVCDPTNRILLCTHSNSAADLYIKDYFHIWIKEGVKNIKPLRIYYEKRWVSAVHSTVLEYCIVQNYSKSRNFKLPGAEDLKHYNVVVSTLATSLYLSTLDLLPGFFTHILIDEAAQALECETITPLILTNNRTRVVLAGDHMQMGPDIFSPFAKVRKMDVSLLERLYYHYPKRFNCKIMLCENYRSHESIIDFTSACFYEQKLIPGGKQPKHKIYFPLTFFSTRGEEVQDKNSTAYYNNSEVSEIVERVKEIKSSWPINVWGDFNEQSISVVTPYTDQVHRIRSALRKNRLDSVCVERVQNVQGKQFRIILLSTVRTFKMSYCKSNENEVDFGFLSDSKLLNTAITRAQSLVAVVGDPVALCAIGKCRKIWEKFIQISNENDSFYGVTWNQLKLQLDGIELKKIYNLNPLAVEFVPRRMRHLRNSESLTRPSFSNPVPAIPPHSHPLPVPIQYPQPYTMHPPNRFVPAHMYNNSMCPPNPIIIFRPMDQNLPHVQRLLPPGSIRPQLLPGPIPSTMCNTNTPHSLNGVSRPPTVSTPPLLDSRFAPSPRPVFDMVPTLPKQTSVHIEFLNLLPYNMSLVDMLQNRPKQERWYNYLKANIGIDSAEKFKYLIYVSTQKGNLNIPADLFNVGNNANLVVKPTLSKVNCIEAKEFLSGSPLFQNKVHQIPNNDVPNSLEGQFNNLRAS